MADMSADLRELRELREDHAAGRLTLHEFGKRVGDALQSEARAPDADGPFAPHLVDREKVLWVGRPDASKLFDATDRFLIPFSLVWGGFAIFWEATVIATGAPLFFVLFGLPFVAFGLYLIFGRFVQRRLVRRRTWYAVTDRRVLVLERKRSGDDLQAAFIDSLPAVTHSGDSVVFTNTPLAFSGIRDAAYVADLVAQLRQRRPQQ
jgi:hypothetical protein